MDALFNCKSQLTAEEYFEAIDGLVAEGTTSGKDKTEARIGFTALNQKRIKRNLKTYQPSDELKMILCNLSGPQKWYIFTEAWCGDSAQISPILSRIADESQGMIEVKFIFRDDNEELMKDYLTNGAQAIPKLVAFDESGFELFQFGPRPANAQAILLDWKANPNGRSHDDFERELHTFYAKDKGKSIEEELIQILRPHQCVACYP